MRPEKLTWGKRATGYLQPSDTSLHRVAADQASFTQASHDLKSYCPTLLA